MCKKFKVAKRVQGKNLNDCSKPPCWRALPTVRSFTSDAIASLGAINDWRCFTIVLVLLGLLTELTGIELQSSSNAKQPLNPDVASDNPEGLPLVALNYSLPSISLEWNARHETGIGIPASAGGHVRLPTRTENLNRHLSSLYKRTFQLSRKSESGVEQHSDSTDDRTMLHDSIHPSVKREQRETHKYSGSYHKRTRSHVGHNYLEQADNKKAILINDHDDWENIENYRPKTVAVESVKGADGGSSKQKSIPSSSELHETNIYQQQASFSFKASSTSHASAIVSKTSDHNQKNKNEGQSQERSDSSQREAESDLDDNFFSIPDSKQLGSSLSLSSTTRSSSMRHQNQRHGSKGSSKAQRYPPIRHIWAILHRRPSPWNTSSDLKDNVNKRRRNRSASATKADPRFKDQPPKSSRKHHQCLVRRDPHLKTPDVMKIAGGTKWAHVVCSLKTTENRVKEILDVLEVACPHHKVCEVLSANDLRQIESKNHPTCVSWVEKWLKEIHRLFVHIQEFGNVFQMKFDIGNYTKVFEESVVNNECKDAYTFWLCSTKLPLYLRDIRGQENKVEGCDDICLNVEKKCPFHIKETELDKAAGNPTFICEDGSVPTVVTPINEPSNCCYKNISVPDPGGYVYINSKRSNSKCVEPNTFNTLGDKHRRLNSTGSSFSPPNESPNNLLSNISRLHSSNIVGGTHSFSFDHSTSREFLIPEDQFDPLPSVERTQIHSVSQTCDSLVPPKAPPDAKTVFEFNITVSSKAILWRKWNNGRLSPTSSTMPGSNDGDGSTWETFIGSIVDFIDWLGSTSEELDEEENLKWEGKVLTSPSTTATSITSTTTITSGASGLFVHNKQVPAKFPSEGFSYPGEIGSSSCFITFRKVLSSFTRQDLLLAVAYYFATNILVLLLVFPVGMPFFSVRSFFIFDLWDIS